MKHYVLSFLAPSIFLVLSAQGQVLSDSCFVFRNGSYSGTQISKSQFFSIVHSEGGSYPGCAYGSIVGTSEGRFYAKKEDGNVHRLGGEYVSEFDASVLASQNNMAFYTCAKIVCGQNPVNTNPGMIEPEEQIAQRARIVGAAAGRIALQNNLQEYLKFISYVHQIKTSLNGLSEEYLKDQAVSTVSYQKGYSEGLAECKASCHKDGKKIGADSASSQAISIVDQKLDSGFEASKKPVFQPIEIPSQAQRLANLYPPNAYGENPSDYWSQANEIYSNNLNSISSCGSSGCTTYGGIQVNTEYSISSLVSLLTSSRNLLDYNNNVVVENLFGLFESQSLSVAVDDPGIYNYLNKITNSSYFQNSSENKTIFKKYFLEAAAEVIGSQWPNEVNKYANYYSVQGHANDITQVVVKKLGYGIGYNKGYAENFLSPAQDGYKSVFNESFKASYLSRVQFYEKNPMLTDVKVAVSNNKGTDKYSPYDDVFLTLKGLSNKGFVEGEITCSLSSSDSKIQPTQTKKFKIPAFTKTDKEIPLGILAKLKGEKFSSPNSSVDFKVDCGGNSFAVRAETTWTETIKRMASEERPGYLNAYTGFLIFQLNAAYNGKFKSYKQQDTVFDVLAKELVSTYSSLSTVEKARLDAQKDTIINGAFGAEPKKKFFSKNVSYKLYQTMRSYFSPIGWTVAPSKK